MGRVRKRKTNRGVSQTILENAADEMETFNTSCRSVAKQYGICHVTLKTFIDKRKNSLDEGTPMPKVGYNPHTRVFSTKKLLL